MTQRANFQVYIEEITLLESKLSIGGTGDTSSFKFIGEKWLAQWLERSLSTREAGGSNPGRVIPKTLKMVPVAFSLSVQHKSLEQGNMGTGRGTREDLTGEDRFATYLIAWNCSSHEISNSMQPCMKDTCMPLVCRGSFHRACR